MADFGTSSKKTDNNTGSKKSSGYDSYLAFIKLNKVPIKFKEMIAAMTFQGFDPMNVFLMLEARSNTVGMTPEDFYDTMFGLCIYFAKRGSNVSQKALEKSGTAAAEFMQKCIRTFELKSKVKDGPITLPRVAATFPHFMLSLSYAEEMREIAPYAGQTMPKMFAYSGSPAMMSNTEYIAWQDDYLEHMVAVHKIINAQNPVQKAKSDDQVREEQKNYANLMQSSAFNVSQLLIRRTLANTLALKLTGVTGKRPATVDLTKDLVTKGNLA